MVIRQPMFFLTLALALLAAPLAAGALGLTTLHGAAQ